MQQTRALRLLCRPPQIPLCLRLPRMLSYSSSRSSWWEYYIHSSAPLLFLSRSSPIQSASLCPSLSLPFGITHHPSHLFHLRQPRFHKQMGERGWTRWPWPRRSPQARASERPSDPLYSSICKTAAQDKDDDWAFSISSRLFYPPAMRTSNLSSPVVRRQRPAAQAVF